MTQGACLDDATVAGARLHSDAELDVGSPETVAHKIATNLRMLGATRFDLKYGAGGLLHETLMTNIELYGRQVIPGVQELMKE